MTDAGVDPTEHNRLDEEESPYLRQHADNPVNWQPWDERALDAARERDVPLFVSIGYSACHWCHVMEEESFEDEAIARLLNEEFVPVKVDREERPDLDSLYMSICQQVTGRGGWPLSVWLTPGGKPFYVGTYFPNESRRGMPAFPDLLEDIANSWSDPDQREDVEARAEQWTAAIESDLAEVPDQPGHPPDESILTLAANTAVRSADREYGGWGGGGTGPKFPQPGRLLTLIRASQRAENEAFRDVAVETLDAMEHGGLFDHVGGGFHRYCTDREWVVPHFEKMLYDNAEITRTFLAGYQLTGETRYADVARRTFEFVERELTHDDCGFFSSLDAQSEVATDGSDLKQGERGAKRPANSEGATGTKEEGAFYVWTPAQVRNAVDDDTTADVFCDRYGVTERGNFDGQTVLTISASVDELAETYDMRKHEVETLLETARQDVFEAREKRPRPARDEKILAGWNGLLISAYAEGAVVLDESYAQRATDALSFVHDRLWDDSTGTLTRRFRDGDSAIDGYLEDYAFLGRGALDCFQSTGDVEHLDFALDLVRAIEREFWDEDAGTLYFTPSSGESLVARPQELTDQSTPSSAGVAVQVLLSADHFVAHDRFETIAATVLNTHADRIEANPMEHASFVLAADRYSRGTLELTLAADDVPDEWRDSMRNVPLSTRLLAWRPTTDDGLDSWLETLGLDDVPPIWAGRTGRDGKPTVYACRTFACSPPRHELDAALAWSPENESSVRDAGE